MTPMTNPMLAELDAVVRLSDAAEYENVYGSCESFAEADKTYKDGAASFIATHHATLADMAKRMEAAERDAARYQRLRDVDPDIGAPYIARERQDSWGNWKTEWLGGVDADAAIDATQEGEE